MKSLFQRGELFRSVYKHCDLFFNKSLLFPLQVQYKVVVREIALIDVLHNWLQLGSSEDLFLARRVVNAMVGQHLLQQFKVIFKSLRSLLLQSIVSHGLEPFFIVFFDDFLFILLFYSLLELRLLIRLVLRVLVAEDLPEYTHQVLCLLITHVQLSFGKQNVVLDFRL